MKFSFEICTLVIGKCGRNATVKRKKEKGGGGEGGGGGGGTTCAACVYMSDDAARCLTVHLCQGSEVLKKSKQKIISQD